MKITSQDIIEFINSIQLPEDGSLGEIQQSALKDGVPIIPPEVASLLRVVLSVKRPRRILEVGCAIGFSSALMSRYLASDGHITTIDRYDIMIDEARKNFKALGLEDKIKLIEGDAADILPILNDKFDLIFLDAAKGQYKQFFPDCMRLLNVGGILIADDVLQEGRITENRLEVPRRQRTIHTRMREFLRLVSESKYLESAIIPIGDGVLIAHKTGESI